MTINTSYYAANKAKNIIDVATSLNKYVLVEKPESISQEQENN